MRIREHFFGDLFAEDYVEVWSLSGEGIGDKHVIWRRYKTVWSLKDCLLRKMIRHIRSLYNQDEVAQ